MHATSDSLEDKIQTRKALEETFVNASVENVIIENLVRYKGNHLKKVKGVSKYRHAKESDVLSASKRGVEADVYLKLYVDELSEYIIVDMEPSDIVQFGDFDGLYSSFSLEVESVSMRLEEDSVVVRMDGEDVLGEFEVADVKPDDTQTYLSYQNFTDNYSIENRCGREAEQMLFTAWTRKVGLFEGEWIVDDVRQNEDSAKLTIIHPEWDESLKFTVSLSDWEENSAVRDLVNKTGSGLFSNIEGESVWLTRAEDTGKKAVSSVNGWDVYPIEERTTDEKSNLIGHAVKQITQRL